MSLPNILGPATTETPTGTSKLPNILGGSAAIAPKTSAIPSIVTRAPAAPKYFASVDAKGNSYGFSDTEKDPYSQVPLFAYRNPGDTATTTDKTRVATTFDPRVPQKLDPSLFKNGRMPADVSANLKAEMGGSHSEQLDHRIALELSGSNNKENIGLEPTIDGGVNTKTDPLENSLAHDVAIGKKSLFQAQTELAKSKGLPTPWTEKPEPSLVDKAKAKVGEFADEVSGGEGLGQNLKDVVLHPSSLIEGAKEVAGDTVQATKDVVQGTAEGLGDFLNNLGGAFLNHTLKPAARAIGMKTPDDFRDDLRTPAEKAYQMSLRNSDVKAPNPETPAKTAGRIVGGTIPFLLGGEVLGPAYASLEEASPLVRFFGKAILNAGLPAFVSQIQPLQEGETSTSHFLKGLPSDIAFGLTSSIPNTKLSALTTGLSQFGIGVKQGQPLGQNILNSAILTIFGLVGHSPAQPGSAKPEVGFNNIEGLKNRALDIMNTPLGDNPDPRDVLIKGMAHEFLNSSPEDQLRFSTQAKELADQVLEKFKSNAPKAEETTAPEAETAPVKEETAPAPAAEKAPAEAPIEKALSVVPQKGEEITLRSKSDEGDVRTAKFISQSDKGVMAVEPRTGLPMLFKADKFEIVPKGSAPSTKDISESAPVQAAVKPEPAALASQLKAPGQYHTLVYDLKGNLTFKETAGKEVPGLHPEASFFIHRPAGIKDAKGWVVSEGRSGMKLGEGPTREKAIENAKELLAKRAGKPGSLKEVIDSQVKKHGLSPSYTTDKPRRADFKTYDEYKKAFDNYTKPEDDQLKAIKKTQKEVVKSAVSEKAKSIKEVAAETGIKEPNIRRILGTGAKEGVFERVDDGVYILNNGKEDVAWVHTGDAVEALGRLAEKGTKVDMVFLDIPYKTRAVEGGNRGVKYDLISVDDFKKVAGSLSKIVRSEDTPIYYMYSQAESGMKQMEAYNKVLTDAGFQPVAKGNYQKLFGNGQPVSNMRGDIVKPEGIILLNKKGEFVEKDAERNLDFSLKRPKGYQTEKPAELLNSLIKQGTNKGETILDPFAGSGVAGAEAVKEGRKAILIEKNPKVAEEITKPRVKSAVDEVKVPDVSHIKAPEEEMPRESSIQLNAELIPGLNKTFQEDVIPKGKLAYAGAKQTYKEITSWFNPAGHAPREGVDIIMRNKGEFEKELFRTEQATKEIRKMWDKQPEKARLEFMAKVERGEKIERDFSSLAEMYRNRLDNAHAAITQFKNINFLENFFPHFWEKPGEVEKQMGMIFGKRPLQGSKPFTKERVFETIEAGIEAGFKPLSTNPEELVQLYETNVRKFVMAQKIKADMIEKELWQLVRPGEKAPEDFAKIDDAIAKVYYKADKTIKEFFDQVVMDKLNKLAKDLGIQHERTLNFGGGQHAQAAGRSMTGQNKIQTKVASPESVLIHEIGHQIDDRYHLQTELVKTDPYKEELRKLADTKLGDRERGKPPTHFEQYIRKGSEKMATMFEAYLHAPETFKSVAPKTFKWFENFLDSHEELRPIKDIKPSMVLGMNKYNLEGPLVNAGEYYAQKDVARMINNYLSKDFIRDTALGRGIMNVKNTMNAFELGFSAFHLTMETLDTITSRFSIGISDLAHGDVFGGIKKLATSPLAPYDFFRAGQKFFNGDPQLKSIEDALFTGGASLRNRQYFRNTVFDNFLKNVREGNYVGALARAPLATIEGLMRPLFGYYIPRLKVGAFRELYGSELERLSQNIQDGKTTQEEVARNTWNNIENRMGELNYDNLFWNRNLKSSLMLTFRAVGWNLGTARELGGGIFQDTPKEFSKLFTGNAKDFNFTPKMSYTLSLFMVIGAIGAMYQYLHTGKKPESVKDLYYPRNGAKDKNGDDYRIEFPSYLKDLYQTSHSPVATIGHKLAPEFSSLIDLLTNKDFYGDYIRNTNDNLPTQAKQVALYLFDTLTPFTIQNLRQLQKGKASLEQKTEAFFGLIKAPAEVIQSDYEKALKSTFSDKVGFRGAQTPEQKDITQRKADAREAIVKGDYTLLDQLVRDGVVTAKGKAAFIKDAKLSSSQRMFKSLPKADKAKLGKPPQP